MIMKVTFQVYNEDARRGGLGNSPLFPTGGPPPDFRNLTYTQSLHASKSLITMSASAPTLLDLRPFAASQVHIDFTLAAK